MLNILHNTYKAVIEKFQGDEGIKSFWGIPKYLSDEDNNILKKTYESFYNGDGEIFGKTAYEFYCIGMKNSYNVIAILLADKH